jgi:TolB-like protein
VPTELERIVTKALAKDREERYQSAKDLLIDLKRLRAKQELEAELARSAPADTSTSPARATDDGAEAQATDTIRRLQSRESVERATSSGEYLVSKIKQRPQAAMLVVLSLIALAVLGYFYVVRSGGSINSLAIMPFVNESRNPDVEYLSDGMTETLISSLSQLPNLNVKARSSVFRYKGKEFDVRKIAQELNVQAVLSGRVVQRGDLLTLSLELVDAQTENAVWSEQYNRRQADLVSLQSEIARDVVSKLKTKLSGADEQKLAKKYTENADAYQLYLKGRYFLNKRTSESLQKAIEHFNQAISVDPTYALGYAGLADSYLLLGLPDATSGALSAQDSVPKARAAAEKALQIDSSVGEVYFSLGQIKSKEQDWEGAESAFLRGTKLNPNYPIGCLYYAVYLSSIGRQAEAVKEIKRGQELDPLSLPVNAGAAYVLYFGRDYDEAIAVCKKTVAST